MYSKINLQDKCAHSANIIVKVIEEIRNYMRWEIIILETVKLEVSGRENMGDVDCLNAEGHHNGEIQEINTYNVCLTRC